MNPFVWPPPKHMALGDGEPCLVADCQLHRSRVSGGEESYRIEFLEGNRIQIEASTECGFFRAETALAKLQTIPVGTIVDDEPTLAVRGFMLDISRSRVPTMETLRELVDLLARLNYNQLQLYTEHTFPYRNHNTVWQDASPIHPAELKELDQLCADKHIELVPNQNSFGHFERWIQHSEYRHLAEAPDGFELPWGGWRDVGSTLRPDQASLDLLAELYDELLPCFTSGWFNVGCDETFELGKGASRARCEKEGEVHVYVDFLLKIHRLVTERGRRMMFWGDMIHKSPEFISKLPSDVMALEWGYEADHPFEERCSHYSEHDIPFLVCPGTSSWRSIVGRTRNMLANVRAAVQTGIRHGTQGLLLTDWGDVGHLQPWSISLPGLVLAGGLAWNPNAREEDLGEAVDHLTGSTGLGEWLLDAGRIMEEVEWDKTNSSPLFQALLPARHEWRMPEDARERCRTRVDELKQRLRHMALSESFPKPFAADCSLAMAFCDLALFPPDVPYSSRENAVEALIQQHSRVWKARFRPGGFTEGVEILRETTATSH